MLWAAIGFLWRKQSCMWPVREETIRPTTSKLVSSLMPRSTPHPLHLPTRHILQPGGYEGQEDEERVNACTTLYRFCTAWSPPIAWLVKASVGTPEAKLTLVYGDESMDFSGKVIVIAGVIQSHEKGEPAMNLISRGVTLPFTGPQTWGYGRFFEQTVYDENDEPIIASRPAVVVPTQGINTANVDVYHICAVCGVSATRLEGAQERLPEGVRHEAHSGDLI